MRMQLIRPGLPIARQRGSRALPSSLASQMFYFPSMGIKEWNQGAGEAEWAQGKPTAAHKTDGHLWCRAPLPAISCVVCVCVLVCVCVSVCLWLCCLCRQVRASPLRQTVTSDAGPHYQLSAVLWTELSAQITRWRFESFPSQKLHNVCYVHVGILSQEGWGAH